MKLVMGERLALLSILPERGSLLSLKAARILREALVPTEKERAKLKIVEDIENGQIRWEASEDKGAEIEIPPIMVEIVKKRLAEMDKAEQLTEQYVPIYEKFLPEVK
jgi:hypothetical protein